MTDSPSNDQSVTLVGYSERGMVNAICEDILYAEDKLQRLEEFIRLVAFPHPNAPQRDFTGISNAKILVEQSFSDFGDLDLLILLDHKDGRRQALLIEAKVHTSSAALTIVNRWQHFQEYLGGNKEKKSNLFVQLYRKMRLVYKLTHGTAPLSSDGVAKRWSLGANPVVEKAADLLADYTESPWFIALLPDTPSELESFFSTTMMSFTPNPQSLPDWDAKRWGHVTWKEIDVHCQSRRSAWPRTTSNFEWNKGQIYNEVFPGVDGGVHHKGIYRWESRRVIVVGKGAKASRIADIDQDTSRYFPTTKKVKNGELKPIENVSCPPTITMPPKNGIKNWNPPPNETYQPKDRPAVPTPPRRIRVQTPGWDTSAVVEVDSQNHDVGDMFWVFSNHIER